MKSPTDILKSTKADAAAVSSFASLSPDDLATKPRQMARDERIQTFPVVKDGKLKGILRVRDILKVSSTRSNVKVSGLMISPTFTATSNWNLMEVARKAIEVDITTIPVIGDESDKTLIGVVKFVDILERIAQCCGDRPKIGEIMTEEVLVVRPKDKISKVWNKMGETNISGIPVVEEDETIVGIVTRLDIISSGKARFAMESKGKKTAPKVKTIMKGPPITVQTSDSIGLAARKMERKDIGRLPVTENEKLIGIIDREDIIGAYI